MHFGYKTGTQSVENNRLRAGCDKPRSVLAGWSGATLVRYRKDLAAAASFSLPPPKSGDQRQEPVRELDCEPRSSYPTVSVSREPGGLVVRGSVEVGIRDSSSGAISEVIPGRLPARSVGARRGASEAYVGAANRDHEQVLDGRRRRRVLGHGGRAVRNPGPVRDLIGGAKGEPILHSGL